MEENEQGQQTGPGVDVPENLIDAFKSEYINNSEDAGQAGGLKAIIDRAINDASLQIHKTVDAALKDQELSGLAKNDRELELQSELAVIIGRRRFPDKVFENSPEILYGLMIGGSIIQNLLAYNQKQKQQPAAQKENSNQENKENE